ncbi:ArdC-like ssDNA-binding domain-containing protein [Enterococcus thailandicus]|uniref:ArdC-like ssDNA-binding domain-containing protein n=1 Tax=Enterococcus thailandicus TaxID=417368 RepID=UPI00288D3127|nr:ArdC-like ssDNA-binding domain-containing protein [Enterococcus thailandicus]MDT2777448.1 ArdC-like ssDNA-binding domain-containing protein [Enterococcus thailandicus]
MAWKDKQNAVEELTRKMNENIKNFKKDPNQELELLKYVSQFNNYSIKNISLIRSQRNGAWGVASYKQFKEKGYQVQRGEKAIKILAPKFQDMFRYEEEGKIKTKPISQATKEQKQEIKEGKYKVIKGKITNFIAVPVFDITQTDCPPEDYPVLYPNKPENFNFKGTENELKRFHQAISDYAKSQNVKVNYDVVDGTAKGFYAPSLNEIVVDKHLNEKEKTKVLLHELAHAEMHNSKIMKDKAPELRAVNVLEYQAEMTAYIVSSKFELDTEDYSTHYLASWTKREVDDDVYLKSLEEVKKVSSKLIDKIVENYNNLEQTLKPESTLNSDESIAKSIHFLSDQNDDNHFEKLKNEKLKVTDIAIEVKDNYQNNFVKLTDGNQEYKTNIPTAGLSKDDLKEWQKGLTGQEFLEQNLNYKALKQNPDLNLNVTNETDRELQPVNELTQDNQKEITSPKR